MTNFTSMNEEKIKDIMLCIDKNLCIPDREALPRPLSWRIIYSDESLLEKYSQEEIKYTLIQLKEAGYIVTHRYQYNKNTNHVLCFIIGQITQNGYVFIDSAKNQKLWNKIKTKCNNIETKSCESILKIAIAVATTYITKQIL